MHYLCMTLQEIVSLFYYFNNVRSSDLLSKEWCDMVFDGRNKEYGAYRLREQTGARYRYVMTILLGTLASCILIWGGMSLYFHLLAAHNMKEAEDAFAQKPSDLKEGYKVKFLSTARQVPSQRMSPNAKSAAHPRIVDGLPPLETIGVEGPVTYDPGDKVITTPIVDTTGIHDETLPLAKQKIVPTEQISLMPEFPGGMRAFMRWMDEHIVYPNSCIRNNQQGSITISFIVDTDGKAIDFEVKNAFDTQIYRSAMNALKSMPKWKPGTDDQGNPTQVKITMPVDFKLG